MMHMNATSRLPSTQRGTTLVISLLILLVMTLIGVTSMSSSNMEEKMAGNDRDFNLAFYAAEAALRQAEDYIANNIVSTAAFGGGTTGLYALNSNPDIYAASTWTNSITYSGTIDGVSSQPKYIIEIMGIVGNDDVNVAGYGESSGSGKITTFRITARGTGGSDGAVSMMQAYYGRRF